MPKKQKQHPWKRRQRNLLYTAATFLLLLTITLAIFRHIHGGQVDQIIAELRKQGMPTNLAEREKWLPVVPDEENAAPLYLEAFAVEDTTTDESSMTWNDFQRAIRDSLCQPFDESNNQKLETYLAANEKKLHLLHQARQKKHARYPAPKLRDATQENYPHHVEVIEAVELLKMQAWWAIGKKDSNLATDALLAAIAITESLREEPALSSQWHRRYMFQILIFTLTRMLCINPFTDQELSRLSDAFSAAETTQAWTNALIGTRAIGLQAYESPLLLNDYVSEDRFLKWVPAPVSTLKMGADLIGWIDSDRLHFLNLIQDLIDATKLPYPKSIDAIATVRERTQAMSTLWRAAPEAILFFTNAVSQAAQNAALLRSTTTVLAIERFRLAHNQLPKKLEDLIPTYLQALPIDPYDGQPLRYKILEEGYTVYSVYINRTDDDGTPGTRSDRPPVLGDLTLQIAH